MFFIGIGVGIAIGIEGFKGAILNNHAHLVTAFTRKAIRPFVTFASFC